MKINNCKSHYAEFQNRDNPKNTITGCIRHDDDGNIIEAWDKLGTLINPDEFNITVKLMNNAEYNNLDAIMKTGATVTRKEN